MVSGQWGSVEVPLRTRTFTIDCDTPAMPGDALQRVVIWLTLQTLAGDVAVAMGLRTILL